MSEEKRTAPPREDVRRSAAFTLTRTDDQGDDGLTIEGYGAVFDSVTQINSWEGAFEEVLSRGAFRKSLRERTPKMQFDHGHHPLIGSLPLGRWTTAEEDERGLHLIGRLTDNWLTQPFRDAIRDGGVEGMSFRFSVVREEWVDKDGKRIKEDELLELLWRGAGDRGPIRRVLKEVKASEAGPVVWPAYEATTVGVRSADTGRVVIDLARLGEAPQRRQLAEAVALADSMSGLSPDADALRVSLIARGLDPRQAARIATFEPSTARSEPGAGGTEEGTTSTESTTEPQTTASPAADHSGTPEAPARVHDAPAAEDSSPEPEGTERAAGTHSAPESHTNPYDRRAAYQAEYMRRNVRVMALDRSLINETERV
jgi:HK97 family phage prohead protease